MNKILESKDHKESKITSEKIKTIFEAVKAGFTVQKSNEWCWEKSWEIFPKYLGKKKIHMKSSDR